MTEERKIETPEEARQGRRGVPVLVSLVVALLIAVVFWFGLTYYGDYLDPDQPAALEQAEDTAKPAN